MADKSMTIFVKANIENFSKNMEKVEKNMTQLFGAKTMKLSKSFAAGIGVAAAAVAAFGVACVKMADHEKELTSIFTSLTGNAKTAKKVMQDLSDWATNVPFDFKDMEETTKKLLAFGVSAQDVVAVMNNIGNAAATTGTGQSGIDVMSDAIGRMTMNGVASTREFKQLTNQQVDAYRYLAEYLNTDVKTAMDKVKEGTVSGGEAVRAVMQGMERDFKGGMDNLEASLSGMLGTIQYNVEYAMKAIGKEIMEATKIESTMDSITKAVRAFAVSIKQYGIRETLKNFVPPELIAAVSAFAAVVVGIAVPALISLGATAVASVAAIAGISAPIAVTIAAIGAAFGVLMVAMDELGELWVAGWEKMKSSMATVGNAIVKQVWSLSKTILEYLTPVMNFFGMQDTAKRWADSVSANLANATKDLNESSLKTVSDSIGVDKAWEKTKKALSGSISNALNFKELNLPSLKYTGATDGKVKDNSKTVEEIGKDVAKLAKNSNFGIQAVQNMRNLQGKIAFYAADGTNCMRSIGMALEGTPFEGIINVDDAYRKALELGLNRDTGYRPQAGDIVLVGGYNSVGQYDPRMHAAMVTEKGGVIQNGKSHNGIYESEQTPQQMFGGDVTGYIATSQLYNADSAGVSVLKRKQLDWEETLNTIRDKAADMARDVNNRFEKISLYGVRREFVTTQQEAKKQVTEMERSYRDLALNYAKSSKVEQEAMRQAWTESGIAFKVIENDRISFADQIAKQRVLIEQETQQKIKDLNVERKAFIDDLDKAKDQGDLNRVGALLNTEQAHNNLRLENAQNFAQKYIEIWKAANISLEDFGMKVVLGMQQGFQTCFEDILTGEKSVEESFGSLAKSFSKMIAQMVAQWMAAQVMQMIIPGFNGGGGFSFFGGPRKAAGGVASGLTLVGEQGPELVHFGSPSRVFNNRETMGMLGGRSTSVTMYVSTPDATSFKQSRAQIATGINSSLRRGGQ